jgi:hypothetical protein
MLTEEQQIELALHRAQWMSEVKEQLDSSSTACTIVVDNDGEFHFSSYAPTPMHLSALIGAVSTLEEVLRQQSDAMNAKADEDQDDPTAE